MSDYLVFRAEKDAFTGFRMPIGLYAAVITTVDYHGQKGNFSNLVRINQAVSSDSGLISHSEFPAFRDEINQAGVIILRNPLLKYQREMVGGDSLATPVSEPEFTGHQALVYLYSLLDLCDIVDRKSEGVAKGIIFRSGDSVRRAEKLQLNKTIEDRLYNWVFPADAAGLDGYRRIR